MVSENTGLILIAGDTSDIAIEFKKLCDEHGLPYLGFSRHSIPHNIDLLVDEDTEKLKTLLEGKPLKAVVSFVGGHVGTEKTTAISESDWIKTFQLNVLSNLRLAKAVESKLTEKAIFLTISSAMVIHPSQFNGHYSASKAALELFSKSLALEWEQKNIKVISLRLGATLTKKKLSDPFFKGKERCKAPSEVAEYLFKVIIENTINTGSIIDYPGAES